MHISIIHSQQIHILETRAAKSQNTLKYTSNALHVSLLSRGDCTGIHAARSECLSVRQSQQAQLPKELFLFLRDESIETRAISCGKEKQRRSHQDMHVLGHRLSDLHWKQ